ncbi:hypothetical protein [Proteiniborus sp.]|uniref:hypothetical protein n=1 Tax=Proteiniborus sp. TaxID=2079015 RepID=UPI00331E6654
MIYHFIDIEANYSTRFNIKPDTTTRNKYYCVMQNPFNQDHDTKVIYGGTEEIVKRKIRKQYEKFKRESAK